MYRNIGMQKRGELTFSQLVLAALALIVLIVMIMIFTGQIRTIGGRYEEVGGEASSAASKTGWCISTITAGRQCQYDLTCAQIGQKMGGTGKPEPSPTKDACKEAKQIRAYSEKDHQFCCITLSK